MRVAVVLNPVGSRSGAALAAIRSGCDRRGWDQPVVLETSVAEPGGAQGRWAREAGVDLCIAVGGDGTTREVAGGLVGQSGGTDGSVDMSPSADAAPSADTAPILGIVATGTANLFARNLRLPMGSLHALAETALGQPDTVPALVDVGRVEWDAADGTHHSGTFLVVVGMGNDARTIELVRPAVKRVVGWLAYFEPALRTMAHAPYELDVRLDDKATERVVAWSLLAGNVARIPLGIKIFPDARADDGQLHILRVRPRHVGSWAVIAAKGAFERHHELRELGYAQARSLRMMSRTPLPIHLDGDYYRDVVRLDARLLPHALRVNLTRVTREPGPTVTS